MSKESENNLKIQLLASGSMLNEVIEAGKILKKDSGIGTDISSVTRFSELHREAEDKSRWNTLHPNSKPKESYLESCIKPNNGPVIGVSDYVKLVAEQIAPYLNCSFTALGTDGFGRSDSRDELRKFFEINRYYITLTALDSLSKEGKVEKNKIQNAIKKYNLDPEKSNPTKI